MTQPAAGLNDVRRLASADAGHQATEALARIESLAAENEALGRELLRCYEQLNMVFEITEHIGNLRDPRHVEDALLRRYAAMLNAGAVLVDRHGEVSRVTLPAAAHGPIDLHADAIVPLLADETRGVRESGRTCVLSAEQMLRAADRSAGPRATKGADDARAGAHGQAGRCHVLLGALRQLNAPAAVVIALRAAEQPAFDSGDMMASESALGYGGHVLTNMLMVRHLQKMAFETVRALVSAIDQKDNYTSGHAERVGWLASLVGRELGLSDVERQQLEWAGLLHDVGKIGVSESILNKPGRLTQEEFEIMKRHPRMSYEILRPVASLDAILPIVLHHHENHDGSGYPCGLKGENIPLGARIVHVVDIFDALTSTRSYREGFDLDRALRILRQDAGRVTDPHVTEAFVRAFTKYLDAQPDDFRRRFAHLARLMNPEADGNGNGERPTPRAVDAARRPAEAAVACDADGERVSSTPVGDELWTT